MKRGVITLEILIASAIAVSSILAIALIAWGLPIALEEGYLEYRAVKEAEARIRDAQEWISIATTTVIASRNGYTATLDIDRLPGGSAAFVTATISWLGIRNQTRSITLTGAIADRELSRDVPCVPFSLGDWSHPDISAPRALTELQDAKFQISSIAATDEVLAITAAATASSSAPTILFYEIQEDGGMGRFIGTADNAASSTVGFSAVAANATHIYAASGFGSASARTCSTGACDQLQIFDTGPVPHRISSMRIEGMTSDGSSPAAQAITYHKGMAYLGLVRVASGYEFNIIDVEDPGRPIWIGGLSIGRSVNAISLHEQHAYLATSDPERELIIVDVSHPAAPRIVGSWNAPGPANFGVGNTLAVRNSGIYLGRSYAPSAAEFVALDASRKDAISVRAGEDLGTARAPETMRSLLARDTVLFVLSNKRFKIWKGLPDQPQEIWSTDLSGGTALTCSSNSIYIATTDSTGTAQIRVITGS